MVVTNLTKELKQAIVDKAIDQSPNAALCKNQILVEHMLAEVIRIELLGGVKQFIEINALILQMDALLQKLPASVHRHDRHYLSWGDRVRFTLASTGEVKSLQLSKRKYLPQTYAPTLDNPKLEEAVIKHLQLGQQLLADRHQLITDIWAILTPVKTVNQLLQVWPESRELINSLFPVEADIDIDIDIDIGDLNKALRLGVNP